MPPGETTEKILLISRFLQIIKRTDSALSKYYSLEHQFINCSDFHFYIFRVEEFFYF